MAKVKRLRVFCLGQNSDLTSHIVLSSLTRARSSLSVEMRIKPMFAGHPHGAGPCSTVGVGEGHRSHCCVQSPHQARVHPASAQQPQSRHESQFADRNSHTASSVCVTPLNCTPEDGNCHVTYIYHKKRTYGVHRFYLSSPSYTFLPALCLFLKRCCRHWPPLGKRVGMRRGPRCTELHRTCGKESQ